MAGHSQIGVCSRRLTVGLPGSPRGIEYQNLLWLKMLDRTHGFRLTPGGSSGCGFRVRLSKTTDAGATWMEVGDLPSWRIVYCPWCDSIWLQTSSGVYIAPDGNTLVVVGEVGHIARSTDGGATWSDVPTPFTDDLSWVAFADGAVGWAAGAGGAVLHTSDGGLTWARQQLDTTQDVTYLAAFSPNDALLTAGRHFRTSDGGRTWTPRPYVSTATVTEFAAVSPDVLWATAGELLATTDGGAKWQAAGIAATAVDAVDAQHAWALGSQIWRTSDGGGHWTAHTAPPGARDLDFVDPLRGWALGTGRPNPDYPDAQIYMPTTYRTTDGGSSWQMQSELPFGNYSQIIFVDAQHGWIPGLRYRNDRRYDTLLRTADGGDSWQPLDMGRSDDSWYRRFSFVSDVEGWMAYYHCGNECYWLYNGVAHTTDGGVSWCTVDTQDGPTDGPSYSDVSFLDASEGWVVGDAGWIRSTTDGGLTWQEMYHRSGLSLQAVVAAAPGVAYIGGPNGLILRYDASPASAAIVAASRAATETAGSRPPRRQRHCLRPAARPASPGRGTWPRAGTTTTHARAQAWHAPASTPRC